MASLCPILAAVNVREQVFIVSSAGSELFTNNMLTVGTEWLIEASGCDADALRDVGRLREVFARAIEELNLRVLGEQLWHKFPGEGGATGLAMLTESHLACHTYPEFGVATFNLYCCRERQAWPWEERLREMLGATSVGVRAVRREPPALNEFEDSPSIIEDSSPVIEDSLSIVEDSLSIVEDSSHTVARGGEV
jgi:S-adenosylmethionine decarboxylase